jgi:hypothetical protein
MLVGDVTREPPRGGSWKKRLLEQGTTPNMLALLERCLEDDPADRPADAQVLGQELQAIVKEAAPPGLEPVPVDPVPVPPASEKEIKRLAKAKRLVKKPAITLLVTGILSLVPSLFMMYSAVVHGRMLDGYSDAIGVFLLALIFSAAAGVVVFSGFSMMQLRRYRLCMVGSMVVMLCVVGIPIGIWSLMTLRTPGMRSAFRLNEAHEESIADLDRL